MSNKYEKFSKLRDTNPDYKPIIECIHCDKEIDYEDLLNKYGPEGLYDISDKLREAVDRDVAQAMRDEVNIEKHFN